MHIEGPAGQGLQFGSPRIREPPALVLLSPVEHPRAQLEAARVDIRVRHSCVALVLNVLEQQCEPDAPVVRQRIPRPAWQSLKGANTISRQAAPKAGRGSIAIPTRSERPSCCHARPGSVVSSSAFSTSIASRGSSASARSEMRTTRVWLASRSFNTGSSAARFRSSRPSPTIAIERSRSSLK